MAEIKPKMTPLSFWFIVLKIDNWIVCVKIGRKIT